jgi:hypothetical protein
MLGSSVLRGDLLAVAADGVALSESAMTKVAQPKKKNVDAFLVVVNTGNYSLIMKEVESLLRRRRG